MKYNDVNANGVQLVMSKRSKTYVCVMCGYIYNESEGDPGSGIRPGTSYDELPDDWLCPECLLEKSMLKQFGSERAASNAETDAI